VHMLVLVVLEYARVKQITNPKPYGV
jgi:hypothetical protein